MSFQPEKTIGKYASSADQWHDICTVHTIIVEDTRQNGIFTAF